MKRTLLKPACTLFVLGNTVGGLRELLDKLPPELDTAYINYPEISNTLDEDDLELSQYVLETDEEYAERVRLENNTSELLKYVDYLEAKLGIKHDII